MVGLPLTESWLWRGLFSSSSKGSSFFARSLVYLQPYRLQRLCCPSLVTICGNYGILDSLTDITGGSLLRWFTAEKRICCFQEKILLGLPVVWSTYKFTDINGRAVS